MLALIHALRTEGQGLKKKLKDPLFIQTGIGPERALLAFEKALDSYPLTKVIHFGLAGALVPELKSGNLVFPDEIKMEGCPILSGFADLDGSDFKCHRGPLWTSSHVLSNREQKMNLGKIAIAVDMESYPIARRCKELGIHYWAIRAIFDPLDWDISVLHTWVDPAGNLNWKRVAKGLFGHPTTLFRMVNFYRAARLANQNIARAVESVSGCV